MKQPHLSIIVPIYNVEEYLGDCLKSVTSLNLDDIEIILVNDGSTDKSLSIAESFKALYPEKIILITRINGGLSAARNTGMEHANGEWIAFLDSDDFIDPVAFTKVILYSKSSAADVISFNGYRFIEESGNKLPLYHKANPFKNKGLVSGKDYLSQMLKEGMANTVTVWDKLYRKSSLLKFNLNFIEGLLHEDVPYTFELFLNEIKVEYIEEFVIFYRQRSGSIMNSVSDKKIHSRKFILEYLIELVKRRKVNEKHINDYLFFLAKRTINFGGFIPYNQVFFISTRKLTLKKRLNIPYSIIINMNNYFFRKNVQS